METYGYEILETKSFKLKFEPAVFGYFLFTKSVLGITPDGGHWLLHALTYFLRFFLSMLPAVVLDIVLGGSLFLLIELIKWTFDWSGDIMKSGTKAILKAVLKIAVRVATLLIIPIVIISLYNNYDKWLKLANIFSDLFSRLF